MKLPYLVFLVLVLAFLESGCQTQRPMPVIATQNLDPATSIVNKGAYRIKTRDKLLIRNLNWVSDLFPDPTTTTGGSSEGFSVFVNSDGSIILPEIGRFPVEGLTRQALADTLSFLYKDVVLNPLFEVEITNLRVKVLGAVNAQGIIALEQEYLSLGEVIAKSGGIQYDQAGSTIQIVRGEGTQQQVIEYDFQDLGNPLIMNQNIYDNDIVYVPPSRGFIRNYRYQRALVLVQPVIIALNLTLIIINFFR